MIKIVSSAQIIRSTCWRQGRAEASRISFFKNIIPQSKDVRTNRMMRVLRQP